MAWLTRVTGGLRGLFQRTRLERELDAELREYLETATERRMVAGLSREEAARAARVEMGSLEAVKDQVRDVGWESLVDTVRQDARYALRTLRRSPGFTVVAILTLALGIGANTAVFTVVNGVLLRPMPFSEPDRLLLVSLAAASGPFRSGPVLVDQHYVEFRNQDRVFDGLTTFSTNGPTLTGAGDPIRVSHASVTSEFFDVLGVRPRIGRGFQPGDGAPDGNHDRVVVLGDTIWRTRFVADPRVLEAGIKLDGVSHRVIGVMPAGFSFPSKAEVWTPFAVKLNPRNSWMRPVVGRLKAGMSRREAQAELDAFAAQPGRLDPSQRRTWRAAIIPLKELLVSDVRSSLVVFAGAVGFVLLMACANVAHLLLARAAARRQEMAVRVALGAGAARLARQLLTESLAVSLAGGAAGLFVAAIGVPALIALAPDGALPRLEMIRIDGWVLAFTLGVSVLTGIGFGLVPALRAARQALRDTLNQGGRSVAGGHERLRNTLAVAEVAVALILLAGAGLMLKSFLKLRAVDPGFVPDQVITLTVDLPDAPYGSAERMQAFHAELLTRLSILPEVVAAGAVNWRPLGQALIRGDFQLEGGQKRPDGFIVAKPVVSSGYFRAMGIRLQRGRDFAATDNAAAPGVAIISESVGRVLWPGESPIGRRIAMPEHPTPSDWLTIVGVVDDVRQRGLATGVDPAIYQPYPQVKSAFFLNHMTFALRTTSDPLRLAPAIRATLKNLDADLPAQSIASMPDLIAETTAEPRFQARLLAIFAAMAFALAFVGIYGVLTYSVALRRREFGIRMALGARSADMLGLVLRRTVTLAALGIVIGWAGALALTRVLATSKFLFDVKPHDPAVFGGVAVAILAAALLAGFIPGLRARRVDPIIALRAE